MNFGQALNDLRAGAPDPLSGWNGKGMWIKLQVPEIYGKMTLPYIFMSTVQGDLVPWVASQTDILSGDWELV